MERHELEKTLDATIVAMELAASELKKLREAIKSPIPQLGIARDRLNRLIDEAEMLRDVVAQSALGAYS